MPLMHRDPSGMQHGRYMSKLYDSLPFLVPLVISSQRPTGLTNEASQTQ